MLFSSYLDIKKEVATNNRKVKSERAKKAADARWGKKGSGDNHDGKSVHDTSNAQALSESCISNANSMFEQCPSPSSSSNPSFLSQVSNNGLSVEPIKDWIAPTLNQMNTLLKNASALAPVLDSIAYASHIKKFKTYYTEQELKNNPILTGDRRKDVLIAWIKNDRQYQPASNKTKGNSHGTVTANSGKANAFDSAVSYVERSNNEVDAYYDAMEQTRS